MPTNHPHIEIVATSALNPNPRNARKHSAKQISQIAASIRTFGWLVPIIVDDSWLIAAGHGRWEAARQMGMDEVPVIRANFLTDADRRAFALAENRIAELSGWDDTLLAEELSFLFADGYELEITGFSTSDLEFALPVTKSEPETVALPEAGAVAVSRPGDLWVTRPSFRRGH